MLEVAVVREGEAVAPLGEVVGRLARDILLWLKICRHLCGGHTIPIFKHDGNTAVKNAGSCLNRGHRMCRRPYRVWHRAPPGVFCMHREYHRVWWENLWHTKKWREGNTTVTHRVIFVLSSDSSYKRRVGFVFISCLNRHHRGHFFPRWPIFVSRWQLDGPTNIPEDYTTSYIIRVAIKNPSKLRDNTSYYSTMQSGWQYDFR